MVEFLTLLTRVVLNETSAIARMFQDGTVFESLFFQHKSQYLAILHKIV